MASAKREEFDVLSLSFTDVLTCVLGASVALFLIFVAIVKLTSTESVASGKESGTWTKKARSIQKEMDKGFATASLRIVTKDKTLLDKLRLEAPQGTQRRRITTQKGQDTYYGLLYHFNSGLPSSIPAFSRQGELAGELALQLTVGGLPRFCQVTIKPGQESRENHLFSLGKSYDLYLKFNNAHANCRETY